MNVIQLKPKEDRIEALTEFLNNIGQSQENYINENKDYLDGYYDICEEGNIHLGELDDDIKPLIKHLIESKGIDWLFDNDLIDVDIHYGINRRSNELWSFTIGEEEVEITGLYDHDTGSNCLYTDLCKGLTSEDIEEARNNCEYHISGDYLYIDMSYDRVSFVFNEEKFLELTVNDLI